MKYFASILVFIYVLDLKLFCVFWKRFQNKQGRILVTQCSRASIESTISLKQFNYFDNMFVVLYINGNARKPNT